MFKKCPVLRIYHQLSHLLPLGWCSTVVVVTKKVPAALVQPCASLLRQTPTGEWFLQCRRYSKVHLDLCQFSQNKWASSEPNASTILSLVGTNVDG